MMSLTSYDGVSSADGGTQGSTGKTKQEMALRSPNEWLQTFSVRAFRGSPEARGLTLYFTPHVQETCVDWPLSHLITSLRPDVHLYVLQAERSHVVRNVF